MAGPESRPTVEVSSGALAGVRAGDVDVYAGVPYAVPPVGDRRFRPAGPPPRWDGVRDAAGPGPASWQADVTGSVAARLLDFSYPEVEEDCLSLTVWTPSGGSGGSAGSGSARRPVLVWVHGGAWVTGSGSQALYDGAALAARADAVVVAVNYRLGLFGWLRAPEVGATGNEGLSDIEAAFAWVNREIAAFGGDPANVTAFGQSAGATCLAALLAAGRTPFHRAILQSGAHNLITSVRRADAVAAKVRARSVDLARAPAAQLNALQDEVTPRAAGLSYGPVADGAAVPADPLAALAGGSARPVDLIVGATAEEHGFYLAGDDRVDGFDDAAIAALVAPRLGGDGERAARLVDAYRRARRARGADTSPRALAVALLTDADFRVPGLQLAEAHVAAGGRAFAYLFDWRSPALGGRVGAGHVLDVPFVFGTHRHPAAARYVGEGAGADELSAAMMHAWAGFARSGDPGWPPYAPPERLVQRFGADRRVEADPLGVEREAWSTVR